MDLTDISSLLAEVLEQYPLVSPLPVDNKKPIDTGNGLIAASFGLQGEFRSLSSYHPNHGYVVAHSFPQFPVEKHGDVPFVRNYRRDLANLCDDAGFGLRLNWAKERLSNYWLAGALPLLIGEQEGVKVSILTCPLAGKPCLVQLVRIENDTEEDKSVNFSWGGNIAVNRASYGQLTERGPICPPKPDNVAFITSDSIKVSNPNLFASLTLSLIGAKTRSEDHEIRSSNPINHWTDLAIEIKGSSEKTLVLVAGLSEEFSENRVTSTEIAQELEGRLNELPCGSSISSEEFVIRRNLDYILSCCSVPTDSEATCLITDHQLLPLSWNRDAYYMIKLLQCYYQRGNKTTSPALLNQIEKVLRGHLIWLFERASRTEGFWGRSYLTSGYMKDPTFQLDQQCYPLIELVEYFQIFRDEKLLKRVSPAVSQIFDTLYGLTSRQSLLIKTEETPADDEVDYPYHFSSQVLWWKTLKELAIINECSPFTDQDLCELADRVYKEIWEKMVISTDKGDLFCYITDLLGNYQLYHDANDLVTAYAPEWGFCTSTNPVWLNTMKFAFSEDNKGGFYPGPYGGLGSVHTPAPWPLGDVQELIIGRLTNDLSRVTRAKAKLLAVTQWDGLVSEAVHPDSGQVVSRHWFSWPGSAFSRELLNLYGLKEEDNG